MNSLLKDFISLGGGINYNEEVLSIDSEINKIKTKKNYFNFDYVINCSGLHSDRIARSAGLKFNYSFLPFKKYSHIISILFNPLKTIIYNIFKNRTETVM